MCKPHIWSVLCLLLYEKEGSLNLLKISHFVAYYWISYGPRHPPDLGLDTPPGPGLDTPPPVDRQTPVKT